MSGGEIQLMEGEVYVEEGEPTVSADCCCQGAGYLGVTLYRCGCECCYWTYTDAQSVKHTCCMSRNANIIGTFTLPTLNQADFMTHRYDWSKPDQRYIYGFGGSALNGATVNVNMLRYPGASCLWWQYLGSYEFPHTGWWDSDDDSGTGYVYIRAVMSEHTDIGMAFIMLILPEPLDDINDFWNSWLAGGPIGGTYTCCTGEATFYLLWGGAQLYDCSTPGSFEIEAINNHCCTNEMGSCRYDYAQREMCVDGVYQSCPGDIATAIQADNPELAVYVNKVIRMTDGNGVTICFHVGGPSGLTPVTLSAAMIASIVEYEIGVGEDWQDACEDCCNDVY